MIIGTQSDKINSVSSKNNLQKWKLISEETAFETPWFKIKKQLLKTPQGKTPTFYIHDTHDSVLCVCVTEDKKVLIEKQYRPAINKVSIDYPAGGVEESDEDTEKAVLRELKEETGYTATSFKRISVIDKEPAFSKTRMHIFVAEGFTEGMSSPDENESIVADFIPAKQVLQMIKDGEMSCTFCVSATFLAFEELGWITPRL